MEGRMTDDMTRRAAIGSIAMGAGLANTVLGGVVATPAQAQAQGERKTFVLVHGSSAGGWCWRRVADLLEKKGHKVFAPTLTGLGACSHLLSKDINLATHFTDVINLIEWENLSDVVLVGHSYGGYIISGVAEKVGSKIGSIVFLDAFMPETGDSLAAGASQPVKDAIAAALSRGEHSLKPVPAAVFRVNEADRAW